MVYKFSLIYNKKMMIKSDAYLVWSNFFENEYARLSIKLSIVEHYYNYYFGEIFTNYHVPKTLLSHMPSEIISTLTNISKTYSLRML
jgi:hypothetical protein